jgi:transposase InsO family protein
MVGDTTEFVIGTSAKLYLAAILDLTLLRRLGGPYRQRPTSRAPRTSLDIALKRRCSEAGLLHHSDQRCTYAIEDYRTRVQQQGITCSMSRWGTTTTCLQVGAENVSERQCVLYT